MLKATYVFIDWVDGVKLEGQPVFRLVDSGSNVKLIIELPAKALEYVTQIIRDVFKIIVSKKSFRFNESLDDIERSIEVMTKVDKAIKKAVITPEQGLKLKGDIFRNASGMLENGALTQELFEAEQNTTSQSLLMEVKEPKRIGDKVQGLLPPAQNDTDTPDN
ncbi:MAG: hypothetical protein K9J17_13490 [Flavobacteriales bacterium]|nr:hypothetical protein [Flavobacteriales bacterium]